MVVSSFTFPCAGKLLSSCFDHTQANSSAFHILQSEQKEMWESIFLTLATTAGSNIDKVLQNKGKVIQNKVFLFLTRVDPG